MNHRLNDLNNTIRNILKGNDSYSKPITKISFAWLPVYSMSGKLIWLDDFVTITVHWWGRKRAGYQEYVFTVEEHADWQRPTTNNVVHFRRSL